MSDQRRHLLTMLVSWPVVMIVAVGMAVFGVLYLFGKPPRKALYLKFFGLLLWVFIILVVAQVALGA